jgi:hypothetical protein
MKDVVSINNLTTISEDLKALNHDFYLLLAQYRKLKERFYKLKNESEINLVPTVYNYLIN